MSRTVIFASNRGALKDVKQEDGSFKTEPGSGGGVAVALKAAGASRPDTKFISIASAISEGERVIAESMGDSGTFYDWENISPRYVVVPDDQYEAFYAKISNPLLWFAQHDMWDTSRTPEIDWDVWQEWDNGYVRVNEAFARAVIEEMRKFPGAPVVLHDYHLYLVAAMVREALPDAVITHFNHITWSGPFCWRPLPEDMKFPILRSLLSCDIVGFQTEHDRKAFLATCDEFFGDSIQIDYKLRTVQFEGRTIRVRVYPISIDFEETKQAAYSAEAERCLEKMEEDFCEKNIVLVGRIEPSKNWIRALNAIDQVLGQHPELHGKVSVLAFLIPSRGDIKVYSDYRTEVEELIKKINRRYSPADGGLWRPIKRFIEDNRVQALAAMRRKGRVLMVIPVHDGMNLVAKEGPTVNERDGVLILSRSAGAYEELHEGVLGVDATDVRAIARAIYAALQMPESEREEKNVLLQAALKGKDARAWLETQLEDIADLPAVVQA